jgi:SulP family sulfate permease
MAGEKKSLLNRYLPITAWLPTYERKWLKGDLIAGLSVWAVTIPSAMAYAGIAGLPVQYGLYAACLAVLAYAVFGTSRQVIVGPEAAAAAISAATVAPLAGGDPGRYAALSLALALLAGVLFIAGGLLRLGFVSKFFAKPVISAFVVALAVFISVEQLGKIFGITVEGSNTFHKIGDVLRQFGAWSWVTVAVGVGSLLLLFLLHRFAPRVPAALTVMILSIIAATLFHLGDHGVKLVGEIPSGLPHISFAGIGINDFAELLPGALGFLLVAFSSSYSIAKNYAARHRCEIDANQEMIALGAANIGAGIFQGFVVQASLSKTATNEQAGGKTPVVMAACSLLIFITLLFLTGLFRNLPYAALGAIVIFAVSELFDPRLFIRLRRAMLDDFALALFAFFGVLIFGVLEGILIGVVLSLAAYVARTSKPHTARLGVDSSGIRYADLKVHPDFAPVAPDLIIYRFDAPFVFPNAEAFADEIHCLVLEARPPVRTLIIDCEMMFEMDTTASDVFLELRTWLKEEGVEVMLARVHAPVLDFMRRDGIIDAVGEENVFLTNYDAVAAYRARHPEG